jgi:hypothetical protein
MEDFELAKKIYKLEEIVVKLRQVNVLTGKGGVCAKKNRRLPP